MLAAVNRRAAGLTSSVSPWCRVSAIMEGRPEVLGKNFQGPGEPSFPTGYEILLTGVDVTEIMTEMIERVRDGVTGPRTGPERAIRGRP